MIKSDKIKLDDKEVLIVKELIKNPRSSDNAISKITKIPVKTVNRKRKGLESRNLISYYTYLHNFSGTKLFTSRQLFIIRFKHGITRDSFVRKLGDHFEKIVNNQIILKHVLESHLGEQNGCLVLVMIIESFSKNDLVEIYNAEIVKLLADALGMDSVAHTEVIDLTMHLNHLHNYSNYNMKNGKIDKIPTNIFVSE